MRCGCEVWRCVRCERCEDLACVLCLLGAGGGSSGEGCLAAAHHHQPHHTGRQAQQRDKRDEHNGDVEHQKLQDHVSIQEDVQRHEHGAAHKHVVDYDANLQGLARLLVDLADEVRQDGAHEQHHTLVSNHDHAQRVKVHRVVAHKVGLVHVLVIRHNGALGHVEDGPQGQQQQLYHHQPRDERQRCRHGHHLHAVPVRVQHDAPNAERLGGHAAKHQHKRHAPQPHRQRAAPLVGPAHLNVHRRQADDKAGEDDHHHNRGGPLHHGLVQVDQHEQREGKGEEDDHAGQHHKHDRNAVAPVDVHHHLLKRTVIAKPASVT
mmetsp:Transcript_10083/g.25209  ORF Transcript_10083/g.25209 Transcript_10083/m.25209 type:complete len:320 (+) Transcript_10083:117-1076(+)